MSKTKSSNGSLVGEYKLKVKDAKEKLADNFCCCVDFGETKIFIAGGEYEAAAFTTSNFTSFIVGGSLGDVDEGLRLMKNVAAKVTTLYSERDFHASVAKHFIAPILKAKIENIDTAVGLAVEYMFYDITQRLTMIHLNGDTRVMTDEEIKGNMFFVGCYNPTLKKRVMAAVAKEFSKKLPPNPGEAKKSAQRLKKALKIKSIGMQIMKKDNSKGSPMIEKEEGDMEDGKP